MTFCGYLKSQAGTRTPAAVRADLGIPDGDPLVLATAGGGDDSGPVLDATIDALAQLSNASSGRRIHALVVTGPQTAREHADALQTKAAQVRDLRVVEFTNDMASYIAAADLVVSMGGYNTVCEVLSLAQRAIVIPRSRPVEEQRIRSERLATLGLLRSLDPDRLSGPVLAQHRRGTQPTAATRRSTPPAEHGRPHEPHRSDC